MQIKGFHSVRSNKLNIGRKGEDLAEDTVGWDRFGNVHATVAILFEIFWHSISLFQF
jgi:hypothetical protein